jgi:hypothetical protein
MLVLVEFTHAAVIVALGTQAVDQGCVSVAVHMC